MPVVLTQTPSDSPNAKLPRSLRRCRDCGHIVSKSAKICPSCGRPEPGKRKASRAAKVLVFLLGMVFLWYVINSINLGPSINSSSSSTPVSPTAAPQTDGPSAQVDLHATIDFDGPMLHIQNDDTFDWSNIEFTINQGLLSGYRAKLDRLPAGRIYDVGMGTFANGSASRFDYLTTKPETMAISCDTKNGKGFWVGKFK